MSASPSIPSSSPTTVILLFESRSAAWSAMKDLLIEGYAVHPIPADPTARVLGCAEAGWCVSPDPRHVEDLLRSVSHALAGMSSPDDFYHPMGALRQYAYRLYPQRRLLVLQGKEEELCRRVAAYQSVAHLVDWITAPHPTPPQARDTFRYST